MVDAIAGRALRASPALAKRLADAESELAGLASKTHTTPQVAPEALPPRIVDAYLEAVRDLPKSQSETDVDRSRAQLLELLGPIEVEATEAAIRFRTKKGAVEGALSRMAGGPPFFW